MKLNKIHHVAVICSDYEQSKQFYTEVLGLKIVSEHYREERQSWKADKETEMLTEEPLVVSIDGVSTRVAPGETVRLAPGQSICYEPYLYHTFWAEDDHCLVGEVSTVNDDMRDNRFLTPKGRFPQIEEDVPAEHLLCNEYPEV